MQRLVRFLALGAILGCAGAVGLGNNTKANAQVGVSFGNWGYRGGWGVTVGTPYAYGYPAYAYPAPYVYSAPAPVVVSPYYGYGGWGAYRPYAYGGPRYGYYGNRGYRRRW